MIDETRQEKTKNEKADPYPKPSVYCPHHGRWTDSFGDCPECLAGPILGSQEWDMIEAANLERRNRGRAGKV